MPWPTVLGGAQAMLPVVRRIAYQTDVTRFQNATEQRFKTRSPLAEFGLPYPQIPSADVNGLSTAFNSAKGDNDSGLSLLLNGTTYSNLALEQDDKLAFRESETFIYAAEVKLRQTQNRAYATPSVALVFPGLANGGRAGLPFTRVRRFFTDKADMPTGKRYAYPWYGNSLTGFPTDALMSWIMEYSALSDADLATLETFFRGMNGRWTRFSFYDPYDGAGYANVRFGDDVFETRMLSYGVHSLSLRLEEVMA